MQNPLEGDRVRAVLAKNIREGRARLGISQMELAERIARSLGYVNDLEGERCFAGAETLQRLAGALGVRLHQLFYEGEQAPTVQQPALSRVIREFRRKMHADVEAIVTRYEMLLGLQKKK